MARSFIGRFWKLTVWVVMWVANPHMALADTWSFSWDNDMLTGTDNGYTNGLRLAWLSPDIEQVHPCQRCIAGQLRDLLLTLSRAHDESSRHAFTISLQQLMVTPTDIESVEPQYDDIPFLGYLSGSLTLWNWDEKRITGYGALIGVVGPDSGAENTQKWAHKLTGSRTPNGWRNQLGSDTVWGIHAAHAQRWLDAQLLGSNLRHDSSWNVGIQYSSFISSAQLGVAWRFGRQLPANFVFGYSASSPTLSLPGIHEVTESGWSVLLGMGLEYVFSSYLEERSGPYEFDQRPVTAKLGFGVSWYWPGLQVTAVLRANSSQEDLRPKSASFGSLTASWHF